VATAFHSAAGGWLERAVPHVLEGVAFDAPKLDVYANADGAVYAEGARGDA